MAASGIPARLGIGTLNGFLVACYLAPSWLATGVFMVFQPVRGLYDTANIGPAIFVSDHFQLLAQGTLRFAQFLALGKITVAAFLITFLCASLARIANGRSDGREQLVVGLCLAGVISFLSLLMANYVGEAQALRLHATETLLIAGALIILMTEPDAHANFERDADAAKMAIQSGIPASSTLA